MSPQWTADIAKDLVEYLCICVVCIFKWAVDIVNKEPINLDICLGHSSYSQSPIIWLKNESLQSDNVEKKK